MKSKLIKITDETINNLLKNDIILPSTYFKEFDKNAKTFKINLEDEKFENEVNEVIVEEFETINSYMTNAQSNIQKISNATQDAKSAIKNRDENELTKIYKQMETLQNEISELQSEMYLDPMTHSYNKKWLYSEFIDQDGNTKTDGIMSLIYANDYTYIKEEHGSLIADNLLIFINRFMVKKLRDEGVKYDIARYNKDKFLLFFYDNNLKDITNILSNIQKNLFNSTLKSKSGILLKSSYKFNMVKYNTNSNFQNMLETLLNDLKDK